MTLAHIEILVLLAIVLTLFVWGAGTVRSAAPPCSLPPSFPKIVRPETFPLRDTSELYSTPSCGGCLAPGTERGARSAWLRGAPAGGAGGLQGARSQGARVKMPFHGP